MCVFYFYMQLELGWADREREIEGEKVTGKDMESGGQDHLMSTIDAIIRTAAN